MGPPTSVLNTPSGEPLSPLIGRWRRNRPGGTGAGASERQQSAWVGKRHSHSPTAQSHIRRTERRQHDDSTRSRETGAVHGPSALHVRRVRSDHSDGPRKCVARRARRPEAFGAASGRTRAPELPGGLPGLRPRPHAGRHTRCAGNRAATLCHPRGCADVRRFLESRRVRSPRQDPEDSPLWVCRRGGARCISGEFPLQPGRRRDVDGGFGACR